MDFNSHARVGRDAIEPVLQNWITNFNSHARVGRDGNKTMEHVTQRDFNSHARVGRDDHVLTDHVLIRISTHTPAWGVTVHAKQSTSAPKFQLTRPRGA